MKFLKVTLSIKYIENTDKLLLELDEWLSSDNIDMNIEENEKDITIFIAKGENAVNLKDFALEWKIIKEIGLKYNLFTETNYLQSFEINETKNTKEKKPLSDEEIQNRITKVPDNDPKLLDILNQIKNVKKL